jgi:ubiquinone/menaquinone biosynthesis C-methylase UbiE
MLREIAHFLRGVPTALRLKANAASQAELYDEVMLRGEAAGMAAWRAELARGLQGEVLEIGAGTGLMFPYYAGDLEVTALEPDEAFLALARPRAEAAPARIRMETGTAEDLPFDAGRFDAVVVSLVLCSVPSVPAALGEIGRVLRPGGEVRLIEHVRSERPLAGWLMDAANPIWLRLNQQGCNMNRPAEALLRHAGWTLHESRPFQVFSPALPAFPMRWMRAAPG